MSINPKKIGHAGSPKKIGHTGMNRHAHHIVLVQYGTDTIPYRPSADMGPGIDTGNLDKNQISLHEF